MNTPFREQRIAPDEVRRVVQRASDLSRASNESAGDEPLTQDELEHHARALGIAPKFVRQAQSSSSETATRAPSHFWTGGPVPVVLDADIPRAISESDQQELFDTVEFTLGLKGKVERQGGQVTWQPLEHLYAVPRPLSVRVLVQRGRTQVRIEERLTGFAGGMLGGVGLGAGIPLAIATIVIGTLVAKAPVPSVVLAIAFFATLVLSMRQVVRGVVMRRTQQLNEVMQRLRTQLDQMEGTAPSSRAVNGAERTGVRVTSETQRQDDRDGTFETERETEREGDALRARVR